MGDRCSAPVFLGATGAGVTLLFGIAAAPLTAAAQRITITPSVGAYLPLKSQNAGSQSECFERDPDCTTTIWRMRIQPGTAFGLKVAAEWDGVIGIELSVANAATDRLRQVTLIEPPNRSTSTTYTYSPVHTTVAALRMTMIRAVGTRVDVAIGAGFSLTGLSGSGYQTNDGFGRLDDRTLLGPTVSATLRFAATPLARFELGVTSSFYSVDPERPDRDQRSFPQHDMTVSAGFAMALPN